MARYDYLDKIKQNEDAGTGTKKCVVYLDEIHIHPSCGVGKFWQPKNSPGSSKPISPGARWILIHAGGERGFVPNCCLIYRSKSLSADYHHDLNSSNFKKWITEKLISKLQEPCIIVKGNASYYSVQLNKLPTQASCIPDIKTGLNNNNIPYENSWRKC
ncbi:hypothetical protein EVAR_14868_1 [Eumeta japonica]|uniref:DDE-1 domain-containing protein n=1 Tax=Eumeta variegata TaxID=151549 RepID=A0A4C1V4I5_EUMVA|nr:hypothetical protein EVAR_14868_1 [Eumeta japonica]